MNEIAIKRHNFDLAKNRLKEFSEKTKAELEIDKVPVMVRGLNSLVIM